jgi:cytochrome c oxidase subunit III
VSLSPPPLAADFRPDPRKAGLVAFLVSEVALFGTLIVAYFSFLGKNQAGPTPSEALSLPLVIGTTTCLLASSYTIHRAEKALHQRSASFALWWSLTILLGLAFLAGTGYEWYELIVRHHLTPSRNAFGSTYFTLVGLHAIHVTLGVLALGLVLQLFLAGRLPKDDSVPVELVAWYWHFVDGVWVVVFTVVYLIGR